MFAFPFMAGQITVVIGWILFRIIIYLKYKQSSWKREVIQILYLINLLVIYRITFHPFAKIAGHVQPLLFDISTAWPFRINLIPFVNLLDYPTKGEILINVIGNSTMFIPTGIMTPLIYKHLDSFHKTVRTGFLISLIIEIIQLPFAVRCSDVDDLILNTLGCILGYGILALFRSIKAGCTRSN